MQIYKFIYNLLFSRINNSAASWYFKTYPHNCLEQRKLITLKSIQHYFGDTYVDRLNHIPAGYDFDNKVHDFINNQPIIRIARKLNYKGK